MADLIERDALLKDIRSECPESETCISCDACINCIVNRQPAVNRWIPCSERLPDKDEFVICFCRANITEVLYWNGSSWHSTDAYRGYLSGFVTHWMPLPEPPESEVKENDG